MSLFERDRSAERTPTSLVTGFLGSGKTTVLNHLLADARMARSLVVVNEFGEIGLDHRLVESVSGDMVLLSSGCVCCTVRGDLEQTLRGAAARRQRGEGPEFDRVLIETTGLADPGPVLEMLLNWPTVSHDFRLDAVLCTVDALHGARQLDEHAEALRQAAVADRLLVTKTDLAAADLALALEERLGGLNPFATLLRVVRGAIDPGVLFDAAPRASSPAAALERWLGTLLRHPDRRHLGERRIASFAFTFDAPLEWEQFSRWLSAVRSVWGERLLRVKGILDVVGEDAPLVIHGVHRTFHSPALLARWPEGARRSQIVFITQDLGRDELEASWREYFGAAVADRAPDR